MGRTGSNEDIEGVFDLIDDIRDTVVDCQVSNWAQTGSVDLTTGEPSLLHSLPAHPVKYLPQHRGPFSDAKS